MSVVSKNGVAALVAEFLGTALLTLVVLAALKGVGIPYFVCLAAGMAVAAGIYVFGKVSGGHFNPAVTLGLWSVRRVETVQAIVYLAAQLLGALAATELFTYLVNEGRSANVAGEFQAQILIAEALGTFILCIGIAAAVYNNYSNAKTATVVGMSLFLGALTATIASGGVINPALALGLHTWAWSTYVLGPVLGAVIAFNLYSLLFTPAEVVVVKEKPAKVVAAKNKRK